MDIVEDNSFFQKLGLIKTLDLQLKCSTDEFRELFNQHVGLGQTFIGVSRIRHEFQGKIRNKTFDIYRSTTMFDFNVVMAKGTYQESDKGLQLNIKVFLPMTNFIIFAVVILAIYLVVTLSLFSSDNLRNYIWTLMIASVALLTFWTLWPYLNIRNNLKKVTVDLERELNFWLTSTNAPQQ